ncbi:MAG: ribbon-helix-helix domain-containing protein [Egibacteraceae bacterium]
MPANRRNEVQLAVRVPKSMLDAVDQLIPELHATRADAIRAAVELYLYRLACERDAERYRAQPLSNEELALADDPAGWALTPAW